MQGSIAITLRVERRVGSVNRCSGVTGVRKRWYWWSWYKRVEGADAIQTIEMELILHAVQHPCHFKPYYRNTGTVKISHR